MILTPLPLTPDRDIPAPLLTELAALYTSNREFQALSGDFPDPDDIRPQQVAQELAKELVNPDVEVLLARSGGRLVGVAITLARHPDPTDPDPWIGLLMVDASLHGRGYGRRIVEQVEDRFRSGGRSAVRLAVLDANPKGFAFWTALGYEVVDRRRDLQRDRPCAVLRKPIRKLRHAGRVAVLDPDGAVFLFRYDSGDTGPHWALPGGGLEEGETPPEGALRELHEETGWADLTVGPLLTEWEHDFTRFRVLVHQHDHIYVSPGPHREPTGPHLAAEHARDGILGWRWWSRDELRTTTELVWPPRLSHLLDEFDRQAQQNRQKN